ncbi:hypothetical protein H5410_022486, partial [Solanum commersonii]
MVFFGNCLPFTLVMAKTRGGIVKRPVPKPSKNKKTKAEEVSRYSKKKKIIVEEPKSNSDSNTMAEIDNYEDNEDDDHLSLPTCARKISGKSYNLTTCMDELGSFPAKILVRARMTLYCDFRNALVQEKNYNDFK